MLRFFNLNSSVGLVRLNLMAERLFHNLALHAHVLLWYGLIGETGWRGSFSATLSQATVFLLSGDVPLGRCHRPTTRSFCYTVFFVDFHHQVVWRSGAATFSSAQFGFFITHLLVGDEVRASIRIIAAS